jgi:CheY-like chemotaxis protein
VSFDASKYTLLVVDDTKFNLQLLGSILSERGYNVSVAKSGADALQRLRHLSPDLVLLDIRMPGMDGFECCRLIKASEQCRYTPVIFLSASDDSKDMNAAREAGGCGYLCKPIDPVELFAELELNLQGK